MTHYLHYTHLKHNVNLQVWLLALIRFNLTDNSVASKESTKVYNVIIIRLETLTLCFHSASATFPNIRLLVSLSVASEKCNIQTE